MEAEEIARLCESMSLSEEDGPVVQISGELLEEGVENLSHCLIGRVLSRMRVNREAFKAVLEQIWNTVHGVEIEIVGDNVFVFKFRSLEDRVMVKARGPWHFDGSLIVLVEPSGPGSSCWWCS
ncbi:hypothetical protein ACOSP7_027669 [Xanthoceras sorbifolium]